MLFTLQSRMFIEALHTINFWSLLYVVPVSHRAQNLQSHYAAIINSGKLNSAKPDGL
jgi:hypothetical protein